MSRETSDEHEIGANALKWWKSLQPGGFGEDRGALARLRRASPLDAMSHEATLKLFGDLGFASRHREELPRIATLACVLSHVREHKYGAVFSKAIGRARMEDEDGAKLKPLRFQRLVTARDEDEIARNFRRALAIAGSPIDVPDLARIIFNFDDDESKRRLTFGYFGAGAAAPETRATS